MRKKLDKILKDYIEAFEKKHEMDFEFAVNDNLMGIISFGCTFYFDISDIVYDVDNSLPKDLIFKWHEDNIEFSENTQFINLESYWRGLRHKDLNK